MFKKTKVERKQFSLQNTFLKAFCLYSLPSVGFMAPSGPSRGFAPYTNAIIISYLVIFLTERRLFRLFRFLILRRDLPPNLS